MLAVAVSVTDVPEASVVEQVEPQSMPAGLLVTLPPEPACTERANDVAPPPPEAAKVAVTDRAWDIATLQDAAPVQAPVQPLNWKPVAACAVRVTVAVEAKFAEQVPAVQLMPAGLLVTVPEPATVTDMANCDVAGGVGVPGVPGVAAKLAATVFAASIVTAHAPVPVQAPVQPLNVNPADGVAVSVTVVPASKLEVQLVPQLMPAGELETDPPAEEVTVKELVVGVVPLEPDGALLEVVGALAGSRQPLIAEAISETATNFRTLRPTNIFGSNAG